MNYFAGIAASGAIQTSTAPKRLCYINLLISFIQHLKKLLPNKVSAYQGTSNVNLMTFYVVVGLNTVSYAWYAVIASMKS